MLTCIFKQWGLVLAGASDFARPASEVSLSQNAALMATGLIWSRWCFVIKPRNILYVFPPTSSHPARSNDPRSLASVNFLVFCVGATQVGRIYAYNKSLENTEGQAKGEMQDLKHTAEKAEMKAEKALK